MICKSCGTLNDDSMSFCHTCGAPLKVEAPVNVNYSQQNDFQQSQPVQQPVLPPKKKKSGAKIAIIIVVIILVLCMCPLGIIGIIAGVGAVVGKNVADKNQINGIVNELEDYDVNDYFDTDDNNDVATDYIESAIDYSDYLGTFIKEGGDTEWGPCYSVYLSDFDGVNRTATFSVDYIGKNASPYYSTGEITVALDEFNSADFTWEDSWYNSGSGSIRFVDGVEPVIELEMVQEVTADWNRSSLATNGVMELYYEY